MACGDFSAGATLLCGDTDSADMFEGDSLVNTVHSQRDAIAILIGDAKLMCNSAQFSPPHVFSVVDVVYCGDEATPYEVKRIGYGDYLNEIRVIKVGEKNTYEAGRWIAHGRLLLLEIGDMLQVSNTFTDATNDFRKIPVGTRC